MCKIWVAQLSGNLEHFENCVLLETLKHYQTRGWRIILFSVSKKTQKQKETCYWPKIPTKKTWAIFPVSWPSTFGANLVFKVTECQFVYLFSQVAWAQRKKGRRRGVWRRTPFPLFIFMMYIFVFFPSKSFFVFFIFSSAPFLKSIFDSAIKA